jgi:hypothetical protein
VGRQYRAGSWLAGQRHERSIGLLGRGRSESGTAWQPSSRLWPPGSRGSQDTHDRPIISHVGIAPASQRARNGCRARGVNGQAQAAQRRRRVHGLRIADWNRGASAVPQSAQGMPVRIGFADRKRNRAIDLHVRDVVAATLLCGNERRGARRPGVQTRQTLQQPKCDQFVKPFVMPYRLSPPPTGTNT